MSTFDLIDVDIEALAEDGTVEKTIKATVRQVRDNLCFLIGSPEGPYCIAEGECEGFWCCDLTSREKLSKESVIACRELQERRKQGHFG